MFGRRQLHGTRGNCVRVFSQRVRVCACGCKTGTEEMRALRRFFYVGQNAYVWQQFDASLAGAPAQERARQFAIARRRPITAFTQTVAVRISRTRTHEAFNFCLVRFDTISKKKSDSFFLSRSTRQPRHDSF